MTCLPFRILLVMLSFGVTGMLQPASAGPQPGKEWPVATPASVGLDAGLLAELAGDIRAGTYPDIHSLLVVRDGRLAFERYFTGEDELYGDPVGEVRFDADTLHDVRSVTKSVVAILFGIAVANGAIAGTEAPLLEYFPGYADLQTDDRRAIHLKHALAMTSGFAWNERTYPYGDLRNSETAMERAADPYRYVLERPIAHEPGEVWEYSGGDTTVLAGVIQRAVGIDLEAYADKVLFERLGIERYEWLRYESGLPIAASGLRLLPRDMAKIGALMLDGGRWRGRQVVPESWVAASLSAHAKVSDRPTGFQRYGYQWWLGTARVGDDAVQWACAVGWGGQRVLVVPSMDLVVVLTAGLYKNRRQSDITFEILLDRVLPAVR